MYLGIFLVGVPALCIGCCATKACVNSRLDKRRKVQQEAENKHIKTNTSKGIQYISANSNAQSTPTKIKLDVDRILYTNSDVQGSPQKLKLDPNMKITSSIIVNNTGVANGKYDDFKEKAAPYATLKPADSTKGKPKKFKKPPVSVDLRDEESHDENAKKDGLYYIK